MWMVIAVALTSILRGRQVISSGSRCNQIMILALFFV